MSHESIVKLPQEGRTGATAQIVSFAAGLQWTALDPAVQHAAKRHFLDTVGVIIAGGAGDVATKLEAVLSSVRAGGIVPVPGRKRRADILDAATIAGTGGHGIELDDGYRLGSVHPGVAVVPALMALAHGRSVPGARVLEAVVAGYETITAIARASHPVLRRRGFHPTGVVGSLGAAVATGHLMNLSPHEMCNALGMAASASAGLFAFLGGGADVKRLHAGHAAREGLNAALLAQAGVEGPPNVLEASDGFFHAFASEAASGNFEMPPAAAFGLLDCYVKPYACCRHLQPAVEALMTLCREHALTETDVERIEVETYAIAAHHAGTGWSTFASAQLSFPFIMALGLRYGGIELRHFGSDVLKDPSIAEIAKRIHISVCPELDRTYPTNRPARVTLRTTKGTFVRTVREALGSSDLPLDDAGLEKKFTCLVVPILGAGRAAHLIEQIWSIEEADDVTSFIELASQPTPST
jgi:2-methylcitrate dehydratase PrpD